MWVRNLFLYVVRPLSVNSGSQGAEVNISHAILALTVLAFEKVRQVPSKQTNALSRPFLWPQLIRAPSPYTEVVGLIPSQGPHRNQPLTA